MATDNSTATETPSFTLLIDPPDCPYEKSSTALLYALEAWAKLIEDVNPGAPVNDDILGHLCRAMEPSLLLITEQLTGRMACGTNLEKQVEDLISLAAKEGGAS